MEDLPPGYRFFPTEEELVGFYLHNKLEGQINAMDRLIPVIDINGVEPWNLPTLAGDLCRGDREQWFFFAPGQAREARGGRPNRTTASGYWKATGSPGYVYSSDNKEIGVKKTMVFYKGRAPSGRKTKWKMNEYRAIQHSHQSTIATSAPQLRREFSLCRIYIISGSFRAFDRRPLENNNARTEPHEPEIIDHNTVMMIAPSSSSLPYSRVIDSSTSSEIGERIDHSANNYLLDAGSSTTTIWNNVNYNSNDNINYNYNNNDDDNGVQDKDEEPVWEWEQMNWL